MNIKGKPYRTIWVAPDGWSVEIIDQTRLPHELAIVSLKLTTPYAARWAPISTRLTAPGPSR